MSSTIKRKASNPPPFSTPSKKNRAITSFFAPSSSSGTGSSTAAAAAKFNKDKWLATLTAEQKDLLKLEITTLHDSWLAVLHKDLVTESFLSLKRFVAKERAAGNEVYPKSENIYSWSRYCPLDTVKVVVLGQDPYRTCPLSTLCFPPRRLILSARRRP
jgi:uracil-DNA glycosylase